MSRWAAKETMQERILDTAGRLFYGQGIRAVGVDTIAAEIGISKRTLYNYFPSKEELILAYLSRHFIQPKASDRPLLEQILRYFDWLERWFASDTFAGVLSSTRLPSWAMRLTPAPRWPSPTRSSGASGCAMRWRR